LVYAVVRTGGKQYKVEEGRTIDVERLQAPEGERVELSEVLLLADGGNVTVGTPTVAGAKVVAEVVEHGRGKKIIIFKYKAKTRHRTKTGHRQAYTRLAIREIQADGEKPKPRQRRKKAAAETETEADS
jgi:large subunit ribosomal protein L21